MNATKTLTTYTLEDRGYDCDRHGPRWDCTAESLVTAIRMLDGFASASYAQPINDIRGCSTFAVYERVRGNGDCHNKIGVVYLADKRPA